MIIELLLNHGEKNIIFLGIKKKIAITYLKMNKGFSTSLHCHPAKKTGFFEKNKF